MLKLQKIWVLFTIRPCAKEDELVDTEPKMSRISNFLQNLFLLAYYGVLFFTAIETDKFHVAQCYLVCIGHPGLFFNIFCFPVIQYLSQLVHHCFSLWYFVQNHQPRSHTRMFTRTHKDVSSDLILFPYTRVVSEKEIFLETAGVDQQDKNQQGKSDSSQNNCNIGS